MAATRDSIQDIWGERKGYSGHWPVRVDEHTTEAPDHWVPSACVLCSNGCGLDIGVKEGRIVGVRGRGTDRINHGRLGPKGLHGWQANHSPDRLTTPLVRRNGQLVEATWDEAMALIVARSKQLLYERTGSAIGFYTSGQLLLEEYYTLSLLSKAGIGTPHVDGNSRLCTATAAAALKISFGTDGQPGSLADFDTTEAVLLCGHNMASQQTVLWARILDRLAGPRPPKLIVIDPRRTATAERATVHLAPRPGTNLAVMNGLLHLLIQHDQLNHAYIQKNTVGYEEVKAIVSWWPPERVAEVAGVPAEQLRAAAHILGTTKSLVSTVLQGFYHSMQGTAAAVQVNNLHLLRGLVGTAGNGIFQMNGQPTSQNTRETGAAGDLPGFRNWENPVHVQEVAQLWNVEAAKLPHWKCATPATQIWRYCEEGSINLLWISATNPAVSMPDIGRVRRILAQESLFVVVQDAFLTETAQLADVVLPAAIWGEKTGTFTNTDRTVHLTRQAIAPPGEARSDFAIFVDYAQRMGFQDRDGAPLVKWTEPEQAFDAWRECSRGRPCDYSGLSYEKLSGSAGIQWPCNEQHPNGATHLYTEGVFNTEPLYCETYGFDLTTGAPVTPERYRANNPAGRAIMQGADYQPPYEQPDESYPLWLTTGRVVYHFHTRTKTGRAPALNAAAPEAFVQLSEEDAARYGIEPGDWVEVTSRRGTVTEPARIGDIEPGLVFIPFHYGYWDAPNRSRAANELTLTEWDAVSKQPHLKYAAVRVRKVSAS